MERRIAINMEGAVPDIVERVVQQKFDKVIREKLKQEFEDEVRKGLKSEQLDVTNLKLRNGANLINCLLDENLIDFIEILLNKIINRAKLNSNNISSEKNKLLTYFQNIIEQLSKQDLLDLKGSDGDTLLQTLCDFNLEYFIQFFVDKASKENCSKELINLSNIENDSPLPILKIASKGNFNSMKLLLVNQADITSARFKSKEFDFDESILHVLLREGDGKFQEKEKYGQCLLFLLDENKDDYIKNQVKKIIDHKDKFGKTGLYYATKSWTNDIVLGFLKNGAAIGDLTKRISPDVLNEYLDNYCIISNYNTKIDPNTITSKNNEDGEVDEMQIHMQHSQLNIKFDYSFLLSSSGEERELEDGDEESCHLMACNRKHRSALNETKPLRAIALSKQHHHLLTHPVITSFLWLKWIRIRRYYNINVRFYAIFVFMLTWFILYGLGKEASTYSITFKIFFGAICTILVLSTFYDTVSIALAKRLQNMFKENNDHRNDRSTRSSSECGHFFREYCLELVSNIITAGVVLCMMGLFFGGFIQPDESEDKIEKEEDADKNNYLKFEKNGLWWIVFGLTIALFLREIFQCWVYGIRYIYNLQNWFEVLTIILACLLLVPNLEPEPHRNEAKRHLAAILIVLSWTNLIKTLGKGHNRLSKYVTMLFKVTKSFFIFLCLYIFFIIAFGLGFYVSLDTSVVPSLKSHSNEISTVKGEKSILENTVENDCQNEKIDKILKNTEESKNENFFTNGWKALVKTTTMFSGEFEFGDLPFENSSAYAPLSYLFFLSFVFFIAIVMMNLLTGLAVDDISIIRRKAEIVGLKTKIEIIWRAEKQLLQCRNDSSIGNFLNGNQFSFFPNDPQDPIHPIHPPDVFPRCLEVFKEKEFIEPAKEIVLNRLRNEYSTDMKIDSMQVKLDKSENEIIRLNSKIDEILKLLKRDNNQQISC